MQADFLLERAVRRRSFAFAFGSGIESRKKSPLHKNSRQGPGTYNVIADTNWLIFSAIAVIISLSPCADQETFVKKHEHVVLNFDPQSN